MVWTLIYEEAFYLLLALLSVLGFYRSKYRALCLSMLLLGVMLSPFSGRVHMESTVLGASFFLGNAMYAHRSTIQRMNKWLTIPLAVIPLVIVGRMTYSWNAWYEQIFFHMLATAGVMLFCIAGPRLPRLTMDLSYSLYLLHCIVRAVLMAWIPLGIGLFWVMLLCTLPICVAAWYLIERPALRLKDRVPGWIARRRAARQLPAAAPGQTATGAVGSERPG